MYANSTLFLDFVKNQSVTVTTLDSTTMEDDHLNGMLPLIANAMGALLPRASSNQQSNILLDKLALPSLSNQMLNYTFYQKETMLMKVSNIASACVVMLGVISNVLALQVLSTDSLERTSFHIYFKWVCIYHLVSLLLSIIRQHTFLLDLPHNNGKGVNHNSRFNICLGLLFGYIELEHCTTASLTLLLWNRVWAQRNHDKSMSQVAAMRNPILLNVSAFLLALIPTSNYIDRLRRDAEKFNMTMCSFSFMHTYGSPSLQPPNLIFRAAVAEELVLLLSFLVLLVEIVNRIIRHKGSRMFKVSTFPVMNDIPTTADVVRTVTSEFDTARSMRSSHSRLRALSTLTSSMPLSPRRVASTVEDMWDKGMSTLTMVYMAIYFLLGMPSRIVHYFFRFDHQDGFPMLISLSLLRQAFQAGTLLFLVVGSGFMRSSLLELASPSSDLRFASNVALFDPAPKQKLTLALAQKESHWGDTSTCQAPEPLKRAPQKDSNNRKEKGANASDISRQRQQMTVQGLTPSPSYVSAVSLRDSGSKRTTGSLSSRHTDF